MTLVKDILVGSDGDLAFKDGDFLVAESDTQHVQHIIYANPGDYKQSPIVGVGIIKKLNSPTNLIGGNTLKGEITLQLTLDGYKVRKVTVSSIANLKVEASR
jgi:hypothetical protein